MNYGELQETYEHEKTAWIPQYYSHDFEQQLASKKTNLLWVQIYNQEEWTTKLASQTTDLEARLRNEFERRWSLLLHQTNNID